MWMVEVTSSHATIHFFANIAPLSNLPGQNACFDNRFYPKIWERAHLEVSNGNPLDVEMRATPCW
jgi:hypothetical protein